MWIWSPSCMTAGSPRIHSRKSGGSRMGLKAESKTQGFPPGSHSPSGPFEIVEFSLLAWKDLHLVTKDKMYMKELCLIVNVKWLCEKFSLRIQWVSYRTLALARKKQIFHGCLVFNHTCIFCQKSFKLFKIIFEWFHKWNSWCDDLIGRNLNQRRSKLIVAAVESSMTDALGRRDYYP